MLEEMNGHTRNQLITEFLMHYLKTGSEDDMKAADIIADEVFVVKMENGKEVLLPVIKDCVLDINAEEKKIVVHMMNGLLD